MKPLRESLGMGRNRRVQGALAASTAVVCALVLASSAVAGAGASCGLLRDQHRPCSKAGSEASVALARERPVIMTGSAGSSNASVRERHRVSGIRVAATGPHAAPRAPRAAAPVGRERAGVALAQKDDAQQERAPEEDARDPEMPSDAETPRAPTAERAFEGSPRPAGPDLTLPEERALISSGWE